MHVKKVRNKTSYVKELNDKCSISIKNVIHTLYMSSCFFTHFILRLQCS